MEPRIDPTESTQGTRLGSFDVTLILDPGTSAHVTRTTMQATDRFAPEVVLVVGALLFAERQMRAISDPARIAASTEMAAAAATSRGAPAQPSSGAIPTRESANYHIDVYANGNFRILVEQRLDGLLRDAAGGLAASAHPAELLVTLPGPYRAFYREMLEAALDYWRDRRPSSVESTWDWTVALRRMNQLVAQESLASGEPVRCESCRAMRPSNSPCLRCGATGAASLPLTTYVPSAYYSPVTTPPVAPAPPIVPIPAVAFPPAPVPPPLAPIPVAPIPVAASPAAVDSEQPVRTILKAKEMPVELSDIERNPLAGWPLATFPRRLGALVLDLVSGLILGALGGLGLIAILVASGDIAPADSQSNTTLAVVVILALYLGFGWIKGETLGMLVFHLRLLREKDRMPVGLTQSIRRGIGTLLLIGVAFVVVYVLMIVDNQLEFIQGTADLAVRVIVGIIGIYILWTGSGQPILSRSNRQTWGDRVSGTVVVVRQT